MKFFLRLTLSLNILYAIPLPAANLPGAENLSPKAQLGLQLFFDSNLSEPAGQSCASCHDPQAAFTDPDRSHPTSKGATPTLYGSRNTPSTMYAAFTPELHLEGIERLHVGGQFLDGRSATLVEQAKGPFLNPLEMANSDAVSVVEKVKASNYAASFTRVFGTQAFDDSQQAYQLIAEAIAEFERSPVFNRFTSKYDFYLVGKAQLSVTERRGMKIFENENKGGCAYCHPNKPRNGQPPLFTDHSYDNIGLPKNPDNLFYVMPAELNPEGSYFLDLGLGQQLKQSDQNGKFKVPSLRNIDLTAPYMHNGYFKKLEDVIKFYSSRDTRKACRSPLTNESQALQQKCWPHPEAAENVNHDELGSMNLSSREIRDLVAFLKTLTDGYRATTPWKNPTP